MKDNWIVELTESDNDIWGSVIDCKTREEAINEGMKYAKEEGLASFRIGRTIPCGVPTIDADSIIERASEQLYDEVGEVSETYLDSVSKEQFEELEEKLNEVFYQWNKKHKLEPTCYSVVDDEIIEVV